MNPDNNIRMSRFPLRHGILMAALAGCTALAGLAHAQKSPHPATPPERHMPEPTPQDGGQKVPTGGQSNPGDRMAPASKVEGSQPRHNNEATTSDVVRKEEADKQAVGKQPAPSTGEAPRK